MNIASSLQIYVREHPWLVNGALTGAALILCISLVCIPVGCKQNGAVDSEEEEEEEEEELKGEQEEEEEEEPAGEQEEEEEEEPTLLQLLDQELSQLPGYAQNESQMLRTEALSDGNVTQQELNSIVSVVDDPLFLTVSQND